MKYLLITILLGLLGCKKAVVDKQRLAEETVMKRLHVGINSDSAKRMHFTKLENGTVGLINGAKFPQTIKNLKTGKIFHFVHMQTLYFQLDSSLTNVIGASTD